MIFDTVYNIEFVPNTQAFTMPIEDNAETEIDLLAAGAPPIMTDIDIAEEPAVADHDIVAEAVVLHTMLTEIVALTREAIVLIPESEMLRSELMVTCEEANALLDACKAKSAIVAPTRVLIGSPWGGVPRTASADA